MRREPSSQAESAVDKSVPPRTWSAGQRGLDRLGACPVSTPWHVEAVGSAAAAVRPAAEVPSHMEGRHFRAAAHENEGNVAMSDTIGLTGLLRSVIHVSPSATRAGR